jgi:hypothetical protein
MNFLAPFFLLGGLALAAPIIYHLVRRTTRDRTVFSSLMFLQPSPPRISKRHRFEHLLLLILRCAALALLAFGFSRPFIQQSPIDDPTSARPKRIVVLVDTSASMRREGLWPAAVARVADVIGRAGPADQVAIYNFDQRATAVVAFEDWQRAAPGERSALARGRMGSVAPSWAGTRLGNALVTAAEALAENDGKAAPGPRQIVLISDLQAGSRLDALQAYEWPKGVELLLEALPVLRPTNAGVQIVADGPDAVRPAEAPVRVRVTNSADAKREQFKLGWARGAADAGAAVTWLGDPIEAYVPPGQSRVIAVPRLKSAAGDEHIALSGDDEPFDNHAYLIPPVQQRPGVLWVGGEGAEDVKQPLFFLRRVFAETPRVAVRVVARAPAAPLAAEDMAAAQLIFVTEAISAEKAAALQAQAEAGKTIVLAPKQASAGWGATLGVLAGREPVRLSDVRPANYAMLTDIDFQHPLFAPFADPRFSDFTKIHFWNYRKVDVSSLLGSRVLAKFDSGDPALLELPIGRGRLVLLTSGWHPEDSQLAVSSKFVPLLWSLLELAGGIGAFATHYTVGEPIALPADVGATAVRGPDGVPVALAPAGATFTQATQPGIYETSGGSRALRFAVNLDPSESRTAPLSADELEQLGVPVARAAADATPTTDHKTLLQGLEAENRQKLWRWFIAATLAVLLVESALAGWTLRRAARQTAEVTS